MQEHPHRRALIDELHARPFADIAAPCDVVFLACKHPENAVGRDRARSVRCLLTAWWQGSGREASGQLTISSVPSVMSARATC